jgi:hypothetical protein
MPESDGPEVEITPEMEEAGVSAFSHYDSDDPPDWTVRAIYEAMERMRRTVLTEDQRAP